MNWMTPSVRLQVEQDPASRAEFSSAYEIFEICKWLFSDREPEKDLGQPIDALRKVPMWKPNGFVAFTAEFRNGIETVNNIGVDLSDIVLIDAYQNGLNNTVFANVKRDMKIPSRKAGYPTRLEDFIFEMEQVQSHFNTDGKSPYDADSPGCSRQTGKAPATRRSTTEATAGAGKEAAKMRRSPPILIVSTARSTIRAIAGTRLLSHATTRLRRGATGSFQS